jgi:hypothetical protein
MPTRAVVAVVKQALVPAALLMAAVAAAEPSKLQGGPEPGRVTERVDRFKSDVQEATHADFEVRQAATVSLPRGGASQVYASTEGRFTVTFPSACSVLDKRANYDDKGEAEVPVRILSIECGAAGVHVEARLGAARGLAGRAAGELVVSEVRRLVAARKATPQQQRALHEEYGERGAVDWFEIEARPESDKGELKVRGYLYGEDIYFLVAGRPSGQVWSEPQYVRFFTDFRPWAVGAPAH